MGLMGCRRVRGLWRGAPKHPVDDIAANRQNQKHEQARGSGTNPEQQRVVEKAVASLVIGP